MPGQDKELIWSPVLSGLGTRTVAAGFFVPLITTALMDVLEQEGASGKTLGLLLAFLLYRHLLCHPRSPGQRRPHPPGEQIAANVGMGLFFGWITFLCLLACGTGVLIAVRTDHMNLVPLFIGLGLVWGIGLALLSSTLCGIYTAAVYRFATEGQPGGLFDEALVRSAFSSR